MANSKENETGKPEETHYILRRFAQTKTYRYGILSTAGNEALPTCFTLENGELQKAVPAGTYQLKLKKVKTPLTEKYRGKYPWFTYHVELQGVPNATGVYIHIGNTEEDTDACILLGEQCDMNPPTPAGYIGESTAAFSAWYCQIRDSLERGGKADITIYDVGNK